MKIKITSYNDRIITRFKKFSIVAMALLSASGSAQITNGNSGNSPVCPSVYFEDIGDLPGDCISTLPSDISADGKKVALSSSADDPNVPNDGGSCDPWLGYPHSNMAGGWTRPCKGKSFFGGNGQAGIIGFGYLNTGNPDHAESLARGISPDGKVVAGYSNFKPDNNIRAVVITSSGMHQLAMLDSGCIASDVSLKFLNPPGIFMDPHLRGRVVVGYSNVGNQYAIRVPGAKAVYWDNLNHVVELPLPILLPNDSSIISSEAVGISDDGQIIVGNLYYNQRQNPMHYMSYGCVWIYNPANPWQNRYDFLGLLSDLSGGDNNSKIVSISGNGQVIVGTGSQYTGDPGCWDYVSTACKWMRNGTIYQSPEILPGISGFNGAFANGANYDGSIIVGSVSNVFGTCNYPEFDVRPVRWIIGSTGQNPENIQDVMSSLIPSGWTLFDATRVSADGNTVIGYGMDYDYNIVGWVAGLPGASAARNRDHLESSSGFVLYPNPARERVNLEFYSTTEEDISFEIYDLSGRLILEHRVLATPGRNTTSLESGNLLPGIYFIYGNFNNDIRIMKLMVE